MENLNFKKQERSYLRLSRIILSIVFIIISIVLSITLFFREEERLPIVILLGAVWILYLIIFLYQGAAYKHFSYAMNEFGLYIHRGVFWRRKIIVPRNRVKLTDVIQVPIDLRY
jgi:membrane protein YdbS with pleckstrin-like domain